MPLIYLGLESDSQMSPKFSIGDLIVPNAFNPLNYGGIHKVVEMVSEMGQWYVVTHCATEKRERMLQKYFFLYKSADLYNWKVVTT